MKILDLNISTPMLKVKNELFCQHGSTATEILKGFQLSLSLGALLGVKKGEQRWSRSN